MGAMVHGVGVAFGAAGSEGDIGLDGSVTTDAALVDRAPTQWRPERALVALPPGLWRELVWGGRCAGGDRWYAGGAGAIVGPDGRPYPLVSPSVVRDGLVYNADWGRAGEPGVADLLGGDPGWRTVAVETGIARHRGDPSWFERLMIGVGSTVAGPPIGSTAEDVEAVVLEPGARPRVASVPNVLVVPRPPSGPPSTDEVPVNVGHLVPLALDAGAGMLAAGDGRQHAYQVVFEEHPDGRRRATYVRVDVVPATGSTPATLAPSHVLGPSFDDRVPVRYLGPDGAVVRDAHPAYVIVEPAPGTVPGDR
jgi:hypothetical protein